MRKFLLLAAAASALAVAAPAAAQSYNGWQSINQRQAQLDQRIDVGVRNGALTRAEANSLRDQFRGIATLEARYRRDGLSNWERNDLDRRFDSLSQQIRYQRHDRDERGDNWQPINQRQRQLDQRIDAGVRDGSLTRNEAYRLRAEFQDIAQLEQRYRRNGLSGRERADLDNRFDRLSQQIYAERRDWNDRGRRG